MITICKTTDFRAEGEAILKDGCYLTIPSLGRAHFVIRHTDINGTKFNFCLTIPMRALDAREAIFEKEEMEPKI